MAKAEPVVIESISSILVPVDGSDHALKATALASDLAEKYEARLTLLHVVSRDEFTEELKRAAEVEHVGAMVSGYRALIADVPEGQFPANMLMGREEPTVDFLEFVGKRVLDGAKEVVRQKGIRQVDTLVEDGDPVKRILEHAEARNADLIVMGSRGLGDLQGLMMGSVSHKVAHLAACTCITVK
ncbi:MAG: universal stress protein [Alphaproteobacteria bacterium]|nr:universal stress protein [Alphaproteobacteria bacterium]